LVALVPAEAVNMPRTAITAAPHWDGWGKATWTPQLPQAFYQGIMRCS